MNMNGEPQNAAVWFEIPVRDLKKGAEFYGNVLMSDLKIEAMGPNDVAMFPVVKDGVGGHLYPNAALAGGVAPLIHLASPSPLEEALGRVAEAGGKVDSDIISLPDDVGRFAYCSDPDGNQFGLFTRD
ncbi:MAG TPA: VOC family protein [Afifellaceae bacterium]|nr:VOC family protein [Afifellaceae bacterium]